MSLHDKISVAVVGLGFGAEFVPIYLDHPDVAHIAICDANPQRLQAVSNRFGGVRRYEDIQQMLADETIDAGATVTVERPEPPDATHLLPEAVGKYTRRFVYNAQHQHLSFEQGGSHHGSHPHLVHEFARSILEKRRPAIDAVTAANWTAAGICAHTSAMRGGEAVEVPNFSNLTPFDTLDIDQGVGPPGRWQLRRD